MTDKRIALEELPMMMFLPPDMKKLVMDCFVPASFGFGGNIVTEGEETDAVYVLAEGRARMVKRGANGEEIPLNVLKPGETTDEPIIEHWNKMSKQELAERILTELAALRNTESAESQAS